MLWIVVDGEARHVDARDSTYCEHGIPIVDICLECSDDAVNDCVEVEELEDMSWG